MSLKRWTKEEENFLKNNVKYKTNKELSILLNRSESSIEHKVIKLGISRFVKTWSKKEINHIKRLIKNGKTHAEIAAILSTTKMTIAAICIKNNLSVRHNKSNTKIYGIWCAIKSRCKNHKCYRSKNIKMCKAWEENFLAFYIWSEQNGYKEGLSIDRIDNNGNYCPENCRWVNQTDQMNNIDKNILLTAFGETKTLTNWSQDARCKVSRKTLLNRYYRNWPHEDIICLKINSRIKRN